MTCRSPHYPGRTPAQGGMGVRVSNYRLANTVAREGQLGTVSATCLDNILVRTLRGGDPGGDVRRALKHFPDQAFAQTLLDMCAPPAPGRPFQPPPKSNKHAQVG